VFCATCFGECMSVCIRVRVGGSMGVCPYIVWVRRKIYRYDCFRQLFARLLVYYCLYK
jgi:hypothetical protein